VKFSPKLEEHRLRKGAYGSCPGAPYGVFELQGPCGERLLIVADDGRDSSWEHVSVSTKRRIPNWQEMCFVKDLFWAPEVCVVVHAAAISTTASSDGNRRDTVRYPSR